MSVLSSWCTLALGGCTYNLHPQIKTNKIFISRPGGAPAPTVPPGYAYAQNTQMLITDASCTKIYEIILILKSIKA